MNNQTVNAKTIHHTTSDPYLAWMAAQVYLLSSHLGFFLKEVTNTTWTEALECETKSLDNLKMEFHEEDNCKKGDIHKLHHNK